MKSPDQVIRTADVNFLKRRAVEYVDGEHKKCIFVKLQRCIYS